MVPVEDDHVTIPSTIFFQSEQPVTLFGRQAIKAYVAREEEGRFMRSFKRVLGTTLMKEGTTISGRQTPFEQIIGPFIAHVKNKAELLAGIIRQQAQKRFDTIAYYKTIGVLYDRFPSAADILNKAVIV